MTHVKISYEVIRNTCRDMLFCMGVFGALSMAAHCGTGCTPVRDSLNDPAHNYATEIIACAATAGYPSVYDRDSDMRCRGKVDAKYGVGQYRDAGSDR